MHRRRLEAVSLKLVLLLLLLHLTLRMVELIGTADMGEVGPARIGLCALIRDDFARRRHENQRRSHGTRRPTGRLDQALATGCCYRFPGDEERAKEKGEDCWCLGCAIQIYGCVALAGLMRGRAFRIACFKCHRTSALSLPTPIYENTRCGLQYRTSWPAPALARSANECALYWSRGNFLSHSS